MSSGMGILGWAEVHPFTIASASNSPEGMILMVKKVGGWTNSLYNIAKVGGYVEAGRGRNLKVMVEGPYGAQWLLAVSFPCVSHCHFQVVRDTLFQRAFRPPSSWSEVAVLLSPSRACRNSFKKTSMARVESKSLN